MDDLRNVKSFWEDGSCGEAYAVAEDWDFEALSQKRYEIEPYIHDFAKFKEGAGRDVLEIGVGMGCDHHQWEIAKPRSLTGIDLTERAIRLASQWCKNSSLKTGNAEALTFFDNSFDIVYSWGVLHHSPNPPQAFREVHRVLRPGGVARIMIYHKYSLTAFMLYAVYGLPKLLSLTETLSRYLESPGTKAYTLKEAATLCELFSSVKITRRVGTGDMLLGVSGQRHQGAMLSFARKIWPRRFIENYLNRFGIVLMIEARK